MRAGELECPAVSQLERGQFPSGEEQKPLERAAVQVSPAADGPPWSTVVYVTLDNRDLTEEQRLATDEPTPGLRDGHRTDDQTRCLGLVEDRAEEHERVCREDVVSRVRGFANTFTRRVLGVAVDTMLDDEGHASEMRGLRG